MLRNRREFLKSAGLSAAALATVSGARAAAKKQPNIIFIMADDMGYGDVAANNPQSKIPTPNLDRLAQRGMRFTDAHTPSAVCTPTRYGVVTGRYCWRSRLKQGVLNGYDTHLIDTKRLTVAALLKQQGYNTAVVGKWHLGLDWAKTPDDKKKVDFSKPVQNGPNALGFDYSFLVPASLDMPPYVYVRDGQATELATAKQPGVGFPGYIRAGERAPGFRKEDGLDTILKEAQNFVIKQAKQDKPFFLYFPLTAPHKPVSPHERFQNKTNLGPYGDFVVQVDATVGAFLETLNREGLDDETLLVFSSDNGSFMFRLDDADAPDHVDQASIQAFRADRHRANHVFRGTKADIWEAGHHVPFIARWPGRVRPGSLCDATICLTDLMATFADAAGTSVPAGAGEDSFSILPLLEGRRPGAPRPPVIHHSISGMFAIREGRWKLVLGNGSGGREKPTGKPFQKPFALFDMTADREERNNVAEAHPDVVAGLIEKFEAIRDSGRSAT